MLWGGFEANPSREWWLYIVIVTCWMNSSACICLSMSIIYSTDLSCIEFVDVCLVVRFVKLVRLISLLQPWSCLLYSFEFFVKENY